MTKKPQDPIPHVYSYLQEYHKGVDPEDIQPISDNELNELANLQKKVDYLKSKLKEDAEHTPSEDDGSDDEEEDI